MLVYTVWGYSVCTNVNICGRRKQKQSLNSNCLHTCPCHRQPTVAFLEKIHNLKKSNQKHATPQLIFSVLHLPISIYLLRAQSQKQKKEINVAESSCEELITFRQALLSINEFDVGSVAGNDWLVEDVIGLIWHWGRLDSGQDKCRTGYRVDRMCTCVSGNEHNIPLE